MIIDTDQKLWLNHFKQWRHVKRCRVSMRRHQTRFIIQSRRQWTSPESNGSWTHHQMTHQIHFVCHVTWRRAVIGWEPVPLEKHRAAAGEASHRHEPTDGPDRGDRETEPTERHTSVRPPRETRAHRRNRKSPSLPLCVKCLLMWSSWRWSIDWSLGDFHFDRVGNKSRAAKLVTRQVKNKLVFMKENWI